MLYRFAFLLTGVFCFCSVQLFAQQCGEIETAPQFDDSAPLQIADWAWTKAIQKNCPTERLEVDKGHEGPVYLWMNIVGGTDALKILRREGGLAVRHIWIKEDGQGQAVKKETVKLDKDADITEKFSQEFKDKEFFDWRTWSVKRNMSPGRWRVQVVDKAGRPIPCIDDLDCEFTLRISDAPYLIHQEDLHKYLDLPSIHFKF